jgi:signal transduction histidine kinase
MKFGFSSKPWRYLICAFVTGTMLFLANLLQPVLSGHSLFLFLGAVIFCSLYGDLGAALIATLITAFMQSYFFQVPSHSFQIHTPADFGQLLAFVLTALTLSWLGASFRSAVRSAEEARLDAERSARAREDLLAVVSHDLKNPLTAIQMNAQILIKHAAALDTRDLVRRSGENIHRSAERMTRLIHDLLDYEKIRGGRLDMDRRDEPLAPLMCEVRTLVEPLAEQKKLKLSYVPGEPDLRTHCDPGRIMQVFSNLIGNAIKFTAEGGEIKFGYSAEKDLIRFFVSDNGPGIPEPQIPHIFDRYWQAQQTARMGTGLGLSIVRGIIEAHGGKIWVKSTLGEGSNFFFTLPLAAKKESHISEGLKTSLRRGSDHSASDSVS